MHIPEKYNLLTDWLLRYNVFNQEDDELVEKIAVLVGAVLADSQSNRIPTVKDLLKAKADVLIKERMLCYEGSDGLLYSARTKRLFIQAMFRDVLIY